MVIFLNPLLFIISFTTIAFIIPFGFYFIKYILNHNFISQFYIKIVTNCSELVWFIKTSLKISKQIRANKIIILILNDLSFRKIKGFVEKN